MSGPMDDRLLPRTVMVLGALAFAGGAGTLVLGLLDGQPLLAPRGARLATLMHLPPLGSLVTLVLAAATVAGGAARSRRVVTAAAVGWALAAVQVVAQTGREPNVLGGTAATLAFFLAMAASLAAVGLAPGNAPVGQRPGARR